MYSRDLKELFGLGQKASGKTTLAVKPSEDPLLLDLESGSSFIDCDRVNIKTGQTFLLQSWS